MCALYGPYGPYGPYGGAYGALAPYCVNACRTMNTKDETSQNVAPLDGIGKIEKQLEAGTSPELLQKMDDIMRTMKALEASQSDIIETQNRFGKELLELTEDLDYDLANAMIDTVKTTKSTVDVICKELTLLSGNVDGMFERMMVTPLICDIPSAISDYKNGELHELTYDDLSEMMREQHGADVDITGMTATNILFSMLDHTEKQINKVNPVPTLVAKLIPEDEVARKHDLIAAFISIVDKGHDQSITRYPGELLDFLHQFEPVDGGHALKALVHEP